MVFDTKTWLKAIVIKYDRGQPYLLQYVLEDEELDNLTKLIDALSELRIDEAIADYKYKGNDNQ
jgi:hypothetical protein